MFSIKVNFDAKKLADEIAQKAQELARRRSEATLAALPPCAEHHSRPRLVPKGATGSYEIHACCQPMMDKATAALQAMGATDR